MTTITKERLLTIRQWRETYGPGSNVVLPAEEAEELARIALASLEAKPIGAFHIAEQQVDGTSDYIKDGEWPIDNGTIEVYAAPPVPVVPEEKPMPNPLSMYAVDVVAAILHGSEPVSQAYKLPPMSSNEVNDAAWKLHNMLTEHGPLNGCQFNNLKECFYEALKVAMRNYPVIPDGWISCSERMPEKNQNVLISVNFDSSLVEPLICSARYTGSTFRRGDATIKPGNGIEQATHWMPLPEPPQEVK
ncbi:DUF551 domain-containing protein [Escherichia coli]|nr:DUF551 domain-containing protein [Escherichia coli]MCZ5140481.1 DUF551 domain-containing protein [Escherichia coli]